MLVQLGDSQASVMRRHSAFTRKNVLININCEQEESGVRERERRRRDTPALPESNPPPTPPPHILH